MNLLHSIKAHDEDGLINVVVEVPKGSQSKIEYDNVKEEFVVDRVINPSLIFPFNYGFIPETWSTDEDPLDVVILGSEIINTGTQIKARIVGSLATTDQEGTDSKIIVIPSSEKNSTFSNIIDIESLDKESLHNIEYFYKNYKINEPDKWVDIDGYLSPDQAKKILSEAIERYHQHFQK